MAERSLYAIRKRDIDERVAAGLREKVAAKDSRPRLRVDQVAGRVTHHCGPDERIIGAKQKRRRDVNYR